MKVFGVGGPVKAVPECLAINGNELRVQFPMRALHKCQKTRVKRLGINALKIRRKLSLLGTP